MVASCAIDDEIPIDPCQNEFVGSFELTETSKDVFPYLEITDSTNIIFTNESGEEAVYNIKFPFSGMFNAWVPKPCPVNEEEEIQFEYETEFNSVELRSEDRPIAFGLTLQTRLDYDDPAAGKVSDIFMIHTYDSIESTFFGFQVFNMVADIRTSTLSTWEAEYFESIEINNKVLTDVYKTDFVDPFIILYYSFDYGIAAFTDNEEVQWVFDRFE